LPVGANPDVTGGDVAEGTVADLLEVVGVEAGVVAVVVDESAVPSEAPRLWQAPRPTIDTAPAPRRIS
jgi:hypothetical protein